MGGRVMGALLAAALLVGAGCGGDDDGDDAADDGTTTEAEAAAESTTTAGETTTTEPIPTPWYNLQPGSCLETLPAGGFSSLATVDCAEPHEGEVVFNGQPGNAGAEGRCTEELAAYAGGAADGVEVTWFSAAEEPPSGGGVPELPPAGAAGADLIVVCVAVTDAGTTGSLAA